MTAEIVNLRRIRKAKGRAEREKLAAEHRAAFGRTKHQKELAKSENARAEKAIEAHRRDGEEN